MHSGSGFVFFVLQCVLSPPTCFHYKNEEDRGTQRGGGQGELAETETMKPTPQNFARSTPYLAAVSSRPSLRMVRMVEVATCAVRGSGHREQAAVEAVVACADAP